MVNKIYLNCGYEHKCKKKDCLNCPRKRRYNIVLTLAEEIAIEDFAVVDLGLWLQEPDKEKEMDLTQNVMRKLMKKIFKQQRQNEK